MVHNTLTTKKVCTMLKTLLLLFTLQGLIMASQELQYKLLEKNDIYELREYKPYIVAQTQVSGDFDDMGTKAFRILFKYISGYNQKKQNIEMTSPVLAESSTQEGEKIAMTTPVIQEMDKNSQTALYSFVMPSGSSLASLPLPLDSRISLKEITTKTLAIRSFSGFWSEYNYEENVKILLDALNKANIETIGKPNFARYNSPFTLWFMRRNEIMIEVQP